jgi:hypothetical protein
MVQAQTYENSIVLEVVVKLSIFSRRKYSLIPFLELCMSLPVYF